METSNNEMLQLLLRTDTYLAAGLILIGLGILGYYRLSASRLKNFKDRYDYVAQNEIRFIWYAFLAFLIAIVLEVEIFLPFAKTHHNPFFLYFAGLFTGGMIATIIGYIFYKWLQLYYPAILNEKLKTLRYRPRISKTGKEMKLLSEEEEDVHLSAGMQAEEEVFAIDYDVWVDQASGEVLIEKYQGRLKAEKCPSCSFYTLRDVKEEILESPSVEVEGKLLKHYQCNYCNHKEQRTFTIARLTQDAWQDQKVIEANQA